MVAAIVALGVALLGGGSSDRARGRQVIIKSLSGKTGVYDLDTEKQVEIEGLAGTTIIHIGPRGVVFLDSPCPHKLCVGKGSISRTGEWILCLPNGVMAEIAGEAPYDGITP